MSIASELQGQPQEQINTLLCTLNCNIALCHSNLGNNEKAFSSLKKIPRTVTANNQVYHCVFAIVAIQEKDPAILKEALAHAEKDLPWLMLWRNMCSHDYVIGLEPSNNQVLGRDKERQNGTLQTLGGYEAKHFCVEYGVLDGAEEIAAFEAMVKAL